MGLDEQCIPIRLTEPQVECSDERIVEEASGANRSKEFRGSAGA
jgi:hypothetical protein